MSNGNGDFLPWKKNTQKKCSLSYCTLRCGCFVLSLSFIVITKKHFFPFVKLTSVFVVISFQALPIGRALIVVTQSSVQFSYWGKGATEPSQKITSKIFRPFEKILKILVQLPQLNHVVVVGEGVTEPSQERYQDDLGPF